MHQHMTQIQSELNNILIKFSNEKTVMQDKFTKKLIYLLWDLKVFFEKFTKNMFSQIIFI